LGTFLGQTKRKSTIDGEIFELELSYRVGNRNKSISDKFVEYQRGIIFDVKKVTVRNIGEFLNTEYTKSIAFVDLEEFEIGFESWIFGNEHLNPPPRYINMFDFSLKLLYSVVNFKKQQFVRIFKNDFAKQLSITQNKVNINNIYNSIYYWIYGNLLKYPAFNLRKLLYYRIYGVISDTKRNYVLKDNGGNLKEFSIPIKSRYWYIIYTCNIKLNDVKI